MATGPMDTGTTAQTVAGNVRRIREARGFSLRALSAEVEKYGWSLSADAINKIENGRKAEPGVPMPKQIRRVDVDDLVALALALNVSPVTLLLPPTLDGRIELTPSYDVPAENAWSWATGEETALDLSPMDGVNMAEPDADGAISFNNYLDKFMPQQAAYEALAEPEDLRRVRRHPAVQMARELATNITRIVRLRAIFPSAALDLQTSSIRTAQRRYQQLGSEIEDLYEQVQQTKSNMQEDEPE